MAIQKLSSGSQPERTYSNREATATAAPLFAGTVRHHQRRPPTSGTRIFHFEQRSHPSISPKNA
jgi:hypothetical protein